MGRELLEIKDLITENFGYSEWSELGHYVDAYEIIEDHPRLLRSMSFGDEDYTGNILSVLRDIIKKDNSNFEKIKEYITNKFGDSTANQTTVFISSAHRKEPGERITFSPSVFHIPTHPQNEKLVAVMLPFKYNSTFNSIKNACDYLNLECKKADDIWNDATFIQDIFELIYTAKIIVADFSDKNPNVFYEVGIAHALGKMVIPIAQSLHDIPSDLRHHRVLLYLNNDEGLKKLSEELKSKIKQHI